MRNRFDRQLTELNQDMIQMGHMIGQAIGMAISALNNRDKEQAEKVIDYDDEINEEERIIENLCLKLLLQQQPVAGDLRVISSALRIGDQAADISEVTLHLIDAKYKRDMEHIRKMAAETTCMVVQSVEAYVEKDEEKAKEVIAHDDIIDDLFIKSREDVISLIRSNPEEGACATDLLMIAKYFERIGDHACNIAEWVIFSITGEHKKK